MESATTSLGTFQSSPPPSSGPALKAGLLAERLRAERHRSFVGRSNELASFRRHLRERRCSLLFLSGQAGVGKTGLVLEFERLCLESASPVVLVDASVLARTSPDEREALLSSFVMRLDEARSRCRPVFLLDSYEQIGAAERWLLDELVPSFPDQVLLVFASRFLPPVRLLVDPAWSRVTELHELLPLSDAEARELLELRRVPRSAQSAVVEIAAGHPLALALAAEQLRRSPEDTFTVRHLRETQYSLAHLLCPDSATRQQQLALAVCALARITTIELLGHALCAGGESAPESAQEVFAWLSRQSFVEPTSAGLRPHRLARLALLARIRHESPRRYQALYQAVRAYCVDQLAAGVTPESGLVDLFYLDRDVPMVRKLGAPEREPGPTVLEPARSSDHADLIELVRQMEGAESSELVAERLRVQPEAFEVRRSDLLEGVLHAHRITYDSLSASALPERDPATPWIRKFLAANPVESGEQILLFRWFFDRLQYQTPSPPVFTLSARQSQLVMSTKGIAFSLCVYRTPQDWAPLFATCSVPWQLVGRFVVGEHEYALLAFSYREHSLRDLLVNAWQVPSNSEVAALSEAKDEPKQKIRKRVSEFAKKTKLTAREHQILELLCLGGSFDEIAAQLRIRPRTVKFHHENLLRKTGASSRVELFRLLI